MKRKSKNRSLKNVQKYIFRTQFCLILIIVLLMGVTATAINLHTQTKRRDVNLQNIASTISHFNMIADDGEFSDLNSVTAYLDYLKTSLENVDVISVVSSDNKRLYHSNHDLIGTTYDGTLPKFDDGTTLYTTNDSGPSGPQRRVYAAIYSKDGKYLGFVLTVALKANIRQETVNMIFLYAAVILVVLLIELALSTVLSKSIRDSLNGYEPSVFSAMYSIRDNILESINEGLVAINKKGKVEFVNKAASKMLAASDYKVLSDALKNGEAERGMNISELSGSDILVDRIPINDSESDVGTIGILHNRAEYTKLMEDLSGTRYLVDSMRANNHDFTNKLHVILGLIQMKMYDEASAYIENVTMVQRQTISEIMNAVDEPSIAALLIGKNSKCAELNIKFIFRENSIFHKNDVKITPTVLITVIGNLINNALESMNESESAEFNELVFGIFSKPGQLLITVEDTGHGMTDEIKEKIFENGFTTKGSGHGTGLYQVKNLVKQNGGTITAESQIGKGTSFAVKFTEDKNV